MDIKETRFVAPYTDSCRKRHIHKRIKNKVIQFTIQLELFINGSWSPILRYDTAHSFAHQDIIHADGTTEKIALPINDYNEALNWAEKEMERTWKVHLSRFIQEAANERK